MPRRRIGQEELFAAGDRRSSLDDLLALIDWSEVAARLEVIHAAAKGEASWPPLAMFRALLLSVWYNLSDVKLAEALDDRMSFRRFCGFSRSEATPERMAFVRFRRALVAHGLGTVLFEAITAQLEAKAVRVKTGTIVDATVVGSASEGDGQAVWSGHRSRKAVHGYKAHVGVDADTAIVEKIAVTPGNRHDGRCGETRPARGGGRGLRRQRLSRRGVRHGRAGEGRGVAGGGHGRVVPAGRRPDEKARQRPDPAHPRPDRAQCVELALPKHVPPAGGRRRVACTTNSEIRHWFRSSPECGMGCFAEARRRPGFVLRAERSNRSWVER